MTKLHNTAEPKTRGLGTRYDKFTPNAIAKEVAAAPGMGHWNGALRTIFCVKCQQTKPRAGGSKRGGLIFCADCGTKKAVA